MQKVTITRTFVSDKSKDGVPFVSKMGKPYKKLAIKTTEHGDKWLSGFQNRDNENWKEGDVVDVIIEKNGEYLNFSTPKPEDKLASRLSALEVTVMNLQNTVARLQGGKVSPATAVAPTPEDLNATLPEQEGPDF